MFCIQAYYIILWYYVMIHYITVYLQGDMILFFVPYNFILYSIYICMYLIYKKIYRYLFTCLHMYLHMYIHMYLTYVYTYVCRAVFHLHAHGTPSSVIRWHRALSFCSTTCVQDPHSSVWDSDGVVTTCISCSNPPAVSSLCRGWRPPRISWRWW